MCLGNEVLLIMNCKYLAISGAVYMELLTCLCTGKGKEG